ncbi:MAG TPA: Ig-like domain-containing protein, partial [Candidatus Elarobacter sp.]|nr:Ig-like domain-containing protein [Candidatus Elarobacter sp.]
MRSRGFVFGLAVALMSAGCHQRVSAPSHEPLVAVSPLPSPPARSPIQSAAPVGTVDTLAQIRVVFSDDLIPLERLESPDEAAILAHFSISPALPGQFRFLTPRMIGFEADRAWPVATRVRVTITQGLRDLHGHALAGDLSWTFQTGAVALDQLPGKYGEDDP